MTTFVERDRRETLAEHLLRNAEALALSPEQVKRLRRANQLYFAKGATPQDRTMAGDIAAEVRDELGADFAAVVANAKAQGEKLEDWEGEGAKRIKGRDGLLSLRRSGSLTEVEMSVGLAYRYCVERSTASLGSVLGGEGVRGGRKVVEGLAPRSAAELQRSYVMARLSQMERAVAAVVQDGRELVVLRAVAGEGRTLGSLGDSGHAKRANLDALKRALEAAGRVLPARVVQEIAASPLRIGAG